MRPPDTSLEGPAQLSSDQFARIAAIAKREAGLSLAITKRSMIGTRIARRLRETGKADFSSYLDHIETAEGAGELGLLISALTTNVSHFFREEHHFRTLLSDVMSRLAPEARAGRRIRIWSAGCATGQEPYSIAMAILRSFPEAPTWNLRILATDIDEVALTRARAGRYADRQLDGVPPEDRRRFFRAAEGDGAEVREELRALIRFSPLNLISAWPLRGPFDVIFCRNVVIYFDAATQAALWPRFHGILGPEGILFVGHSERLDAGSARLFDSIGVTSYRKRNIAADQPKGDRAWN
jgi:chemotaxis protein methyltransferase CheR